MVAHGWRVWGAFNVRLYTSRSQGSYALAAVGSCLGVYAVLAVTFHWLVEPTLAKNQGVVPYEPSPARIVQFSDTPVVPPVRSEPPSRVASNPPTSATVATATPGSKETVRSEGPARLAPNPPTSATVATAAPESTETAATEPKNTPKKKVVRTTAQERAARTPGTHSISRPGVTLTALVDRSKRTDPNSSTRPLCTACAPTICDPVVGAMKI